MNIAQKPKHEPNIGQDKRTTGFLAASRNFVKSISRLSMDILYLDLTGKEKLTKFVMVS